MINRNLDAPQSSDFPEVMSRHDVSRFLGLSVKTVETYTRKDLIPHKHLGRRILYSKTKLLQWIENESHSALPES